MHNKRPVFGKSFIRNALVLAIGMPSISQAALEEIVVTAQKRSESVQDVPIAINALAGDMLNDLGVKDADDIENLYPNLSTNNRSAVSSGFAIRGVGTNNFHISAKQSVGTNIDGVAAFSPFMGIVGVYDMERVEVLRGPQNTLYGRNTTGGVINFYTRQANVDDGLTGNATLNAGNGGLLEFEGAVGFNLSDDLAARIAVMDSSFDGTWDNIVDGGDVGEKEKTGVRLNLDWRVSDATSLNFTIATGEAEGDDEIKRTIGDLDSDGSAGCAANSAGEDVMVAGITDCWVAVNTDQVAGNDYLTAQLNQGNTDFIKANPNAGPETQYLINYSSPWGKTYHHRAGGYTADSDSVRVALQHDFDTMQLNWISAYDELYVKNITIYGGLTGFHSANEGDWEVWQHEVRLASTTESPLQWMTGVYYTAEDSVEDTWVTHTEFPAPPLHGPRSDAILIDSEYEGWSVYGQVDYDLTDTVSLTAGIRYTDDKLEGDARKSQCNAGNGVTASLDDVRMYDRGWREAAGCDSNGALLTNNPTQELSETGWKLGVSWNANDNTLIYASAASGFKGGAYDNRAQANGQQPVGPEYLDAYEIGLKTDLFGNTLQLNASYYWYDWQDLQQFATDRTDNTPLLLNLPSTEMQGVEIEAKWAPTDTFFIQLGLGFSDNEIVELTDLQADPARVGFQTGWEVTNSPDFTANLLVINTIPLAYGELVLQGSYRYMDEYFFVTGDPAFANNLADSHSWLNARVRYDFGSELQHSIALWGNNLTSERSLNQRSPAGLPGAHQFPGGIRDTGEVMWGITLSTGF
ncbi:MAG: TonB-dependent receptor [Gammaproteobacteria bacterium]|nr:TonB-dependent receptor [Gammaproteobacteria bacterium]